MIDPPSGSVEVEASKETGCPVPGGFAVVMEKEAMGGTLPTETWWEVSLVRPPSESVTLRVTV